MDETEVKPRLPQATETALQPATSRSRDSHEPSPRAEQASGSPVDHTSSVHGGENGHKPEQNGVGASQPLNLPFVGWGTSILGSPATSGGDQIALDALLSLGNEHATVFIDRNVHRGSVGSLVVHDAGSPPAVEEVPATHGGPAHSAAAAPSPAGSGLSEEVMFGLLKNYRYEVAPWVGGFPREAREAREASAVSSVSPSNSSQLDICDLGQTFGVAVPCLAAESGDVLQHVLTLSERSLRSNSKLEEPLIPEHLAPTHAHVHDGTSEEDRLLCSGLVGAAEVFTDTFFNSQDRDLRGFNDLTNELFLSDSASPVAIGSYYLLLRLGTSRSSCGPVKAMLVLT